MANNEQKQQEPSQASQAEAKSQQSAQTAEFDGLKDKKPEELTPEELRLMADTMPGDGPGD
jgi:hypothetical protein